MNAGQVAGAIGLARPERLIGLSLVGEDWQTVRARVRRLRYDLRHQLGRRFEDCWHVEPNPAGTGHHVHAWQRGGFVPQGVLSRLADARGMGRVCDIRAWRPEGPLAEGYGLKLAGVRYGLKLAESSDQMFTYLEANGGRLVHASRGFWRDELGEPCGQKAARRAWCRSVAEGDGEEHDWQLRLIPGSG